MAKKPGAWPPVYTPPAGVDPESLRGLVLPFVEHMRVHGLSEFTIHRRVRNLATLFTWCDQRSLTRAQDITKPILERYQRFLYHYRSANGKPLSFRSQGIYLATVQAYFRFLAKQNYILTNPASDLELPKTGRRIPRTILTVREVETVLNMPNIEDPVGIRDRAILETFYATGVRRLELAKLRIFDLDMEHGTVLVREGKCRQDRVIPIGERALAWIRKYLEEVRPEFAMEPDEGILFLKPTGEGITASALSHRTARYIDASGIGKRGSCHLFRHTMATLMLEGGADVRFIQQMLGHLRLETTTMYTHVSIRKLKDVYEATHPGAMLRKEKKASTPKEKEEEPKD